jgi:hypothetical protein
VLKLTMAYGQGRRPTWCAQRAEMVRRVMGGVSVRHGPSVDADADQAEQRGTKVTTATERRRDDYIMS